MKLGLASLLINLLDFEMSKLMSEREPERFVDNPSAAKFPCTCTMCQIGSAFIS